MKMRNRKVYLFRAFLCLALAVILTLPVAVTWSKYVWKEDIEVNLLISCSEQSITGMFPEGYPSDFWVQDLTNIQATAAADGLVLTAEKGYKLPEYITVEIGQTVFSVKTDGREVKERVSFEPVTGMLSIAESLINENPGGVTVRAAAEEVSDESTDSAEGVVSDESMYSS